MDKKDLEQETGGQQHQPVIPGKTRMMHPPAALPALLASGMSFRLIGDKLGCHRDTVSGWAKRPDIVAQVEAIRQAEVQQARRRWSRLEPLARRTVGRVLKAEGEDANPMAQVKGAELVARVTGVLEDKTKVEVSGAVDLGLGADFDPAAAEQQVLALAADILRGRGQPDLADLVLEVLAQGAEVMAEEAEEVTP